MRSLRDTPDQEQRQKQIWLALPPKLWSWPPFIKPPFIKLVLEDESHKVSVHVLRGTVATLLTGEL